MRIRRFLNWLRGEISIILISIAIGMGIGASLSQIIIQPLTNIGVTIIALIGSSVGIAGLFRAYFRERNEERRRPRLAFGEYYRHSDDSYYVDLILNGGQGQAQRVTGFITVMGGNINNSASVWDHSALREYNIGHHMGLRLFRVMNELILFPAAVGHMPNGFVENPRPIVEIRSLQIMVEVNFVNGIAPAPLIDRISSIIDNAELR